MNNLLAAGGSNTITNPLFKGGVFEGLIRAEGGATTFVGMLLPRLVGLVFVFGSISFFFMLIWGAVSWIISGGDKAHVESSKARITNAIVGFVLLAGSYAIIKLIQIFFGINILLIDIGPLIIQ